MPVFTYKAIDSGGARTSGAVSAQNRSAALEEVTRKGLVPVSVDERQAVRAPARDLPAFLRQAVRGAGGPIVRFLHSST